MVAPGRIRRRLALAIVLTALIPVLVAILVADSMVRRSSERFFKPEVFSRLNQSLDLYQELAHAVKSSMRHEATAIAAQGSLRHAVESGDRTAIDRALDQQVKKYPNIVSLSVEDATGKRLGHADRGRPLDRRKENALEVSRPLTGAEEADEDVPQLVAVFAANRALFDERDDMSQFVNTYKQIDQQRQAVEQSYMYAFAALLGITIVMAIGVGVLLARGVSSRIAQLAAATKAVGAGDLSIRVPERGNDEIADLARAFNRMLGEVEASRARIEYLQRIGAWQEMARRLAHEIKNPLTPIQLAVQEIHRRYGGERPEYQKLLDITLEIVEDEVGTLRRLVSEFSSFARMPQAALEEHDLVEFLEEQKTRLSLLEDDMADGGEAARESAPIPGLGVQLDFELPVGPAPVHMDRQMLRRALINLARNAAQAVAGAGAEEGRVRVRLERDGEYWVLDIDDNGPGIPEELRPTIFDPYVTTKTDGTGLGLAIVKKVVVEHGGSVSVDASPLGGARFRIRLPAAGTPAGTLALEARDWQVPPSSGRPSRGEPPPSARSA